MTRVIVTVLLLLAEITIGENLVLAKAPKVERVTGLAVAYSGFPPVCLNGNGYWSMLIRVQDGHGQHRTTGVANFVEVDFSLPCDQSPEWLKHKQTPQAFRLIRLEQHGESVLQEFVKCSSNSDETCSPIPVWKPVPGAEQEVLPFGEHLRVYRSVDLPLAPVL